MRPEAHARALTQRGTRANGEVQRQTRSRGTHTLSHRDTRASARLPLARYRGSVVRELAGVQGRGRERRLHTHTQTQTQTHTHTHTHTHRDALTADSEKVWLSEVSNSIAESESLHARSFSWEPVKGGGS